MQRIKLIVTYIYTALLALIAALLLSVPTTVNAGTDMRNGSESESEAEADAEAEAQADAMSVSKADGSSIHIKYPDIPVASAHAPAINPTAPCMGSSSGAVQGLSIGISLGSSWVSENCMMLETARSFEQAGYRLDALTIRCMSKYAKAAPSCEILGRQHKPATSGKVSTNLATNPFN